MLFVPWSQGQPSGWTLLVRYGLAECALAAAKSFSQARYPGALSAGDRGEPFRGWYSWFHGCTKKITEILIAKKFLGVKVFYWKLCMEVSFKFDLLILTFDCSTPSGCWQLFLYTFHVFGLIFAGCYTHLVCFFCWHGKGEGLALLLTTPASVICFNSLMRGQAFFLPVFYRATHAASR